MANEREETRQPHDQEEQEAIEDLDINESEADKVKGGRINTGDPCDGGEIRSR